FNMGGLLNNRSMIDNLTLPLLYHNILPFSQAREFARSLLEKFRILKYSDHRPAAVSGSVRKATCVLRSLIMKPVMLLLDEPTEGLERKEVETLGHYITDSRRELGLKHVFVKSRDREFVGHLNPVPLFLLDGKIHTHDPSDHAKGAAS